MLKSAATVLTLVLLGICALQVGPAQAGGPAQGVAVGGAGQTTPDYGALLARYPRASVELEPAIRCRGAYVWRGFKHPLLGYFYFKYRQRIDWCFNGARITALVRRRQVDCCVPLWDFKGHIGNRTFGGRGRPSYYAYTQGKFQFCAAWCVRTRTPWVSQRVYANGSWRYGQGG